MRIYPNSQLTLFSKDSTHHSPRNQREAFLYYMSKMDSDMLFLILEDNRTYQDAKKEVFIEKINEALSVFSKNGDTELLVIKGECGNESCHKGCPGYTFIGNCSGTHLDLIMEGNSTQILDICHCSDFDTGAIDLEDAESISIDINYDEEAAFKPSAEYAMKLHKCNMAVEEIVSDRIRILDILSVESWIERHKELYDSMDIFTDSLSRFSAFFFLYDKLKDLWQFHELKEETVLAVKLFDEQVEILDSEDLLLEWLVKYEELSQNNLCGLTSLYFCEEEEIKTGFIKLYNTDNLLIRVADFAEQLKFKSLFDSYYFNMVERYTTIPESEQNNLTPGSEDSTHQYSLKYHLEKRKKLNK